MDDIDRITETLERAMQHQRAAAARAAARPARIYDACRHCGEPLGQPDLRAGGFCTVGCRDDFEQAARAARIAGRIT
jgi:ribosomal protein S14